MERAGGVKGSRWLSLEQVASPQAAATAPETSAVFWSPSWDSMAATVSQGAACELDPGPAPRPCCGPRLPPSLPLPRTPRAGGRWPAPVLCPSPSERGQDRRARGAGQAGAERVPAGGTQHGGHAPSELHAVNRRVEASRLGQGVAFRLELVSRVRARRTCLCRRLAGLMGGGS